MSCALSFEGIRSLELTYITILNDECIVRPLPYSFVFPLSLSLSPRKWKKKMRWKANHLIFWTRNKNEKWWRRLGSKYIYRSLILSSKSWNGTKIMSVKTRKKEKPVEKEKHHKEKTAHWANKGIISITETGNVLQKEGGNIAKSLEIEKKFIHIYIDQTWNSWNKELVDAKHTILKHMKTDKWKNSQKCNTNIRKGLKSFRSPG